MSWNALSSTSVRFDSQASVSSSQEIDHPKVTFKPEYMHHFIEDEVVRGYKNPELHFYFSHLTMECYFHYTFEAAEKDAVNLDAHFKHFFKNGLILDRGVFESKLWKQEDTQSEIGTLLASKTQNGEVYELREIVDYGKDKKSTHFVQNIQIFLKFYIETGSYIDDEDHMWRLLMLFRLDEKKHRCFCGFISYYPFFKQMDMYRIRISQIVILPCYQRRGLGSLILQVGLPVTSRKCTKGILRIQTALRSLWSHLLKIFKS